MGQTEIEAKIQALSMELYQTYAEIQELKKQVTPKKVENYVFVTSDNQSIDLSGMFGDKNTMIVIHNMGGKCAWCTTWADGFSGVYDLVSKETSFYVSSPDSPEQQTELKQVRGWKFPMVSISDTTFALDMGFQEGISYHPGISVFQKDSDGNITKVNSSPIGPSDNFGVLWHLYDLLPNNPMGS